MEASATGGFVRFFGELPDPRTGNYVTHGLHDLLVIAALAVIRGAEGWAQVELFGRRKAKWLGTFLGLPGGIPSHDTLGRVFSRLDPDALEHCFRGWMSALVGAAGGRLIAIDGKSIRNSFEHAWDKSGMAHLVSAFVSQGGNRLVTGQLAVEDKSNEIVAIPKLLALLDPTGAVVTIDAIGCRRGTAGMITEAGGDYVLAVKDNQPTLHEKVSRLADDLALDRIKGIPGAPAGYFEQHDEAHGRTETRRVWVSDQVKWLGPGLLALWPGLAGGSVAVVERTRQDSGDLSGKVTVERHYFISSLGGHADADARRVAGAIRGHWAVENNLHWQLDVSSAEDERCLRKGHGAENFSRLCRIALNLLKQDKTAKGGIHSKRLQAGWDNDYLLQLICQ